MREILLLLLGLALWSSAAAGQTLVRGPTPSVLFSSPPPGVFRTASLSAVADSVERDIRPTHWKEGALIGALAGAAGGALLGAALCASSETAGGCGGTTVLAGLGGALLLAIPGALIGGQFPKGGASTSD